MRSKKTVDLNARHYRNHSKAQYDRAWELIPNVDFKKNARVLDVGCGDGKITAEIASLVPEGRILGIDASPNMIHLAQETFQLPNLEFCCVKAEEFLSSESFDNILCFNCLLWVRKPKEALNRLSKLLKPGGDFLILTYLKESAYIDFLEKALDRFPAYKKLSATHTMLSPKEYRNILESNNLSIKTFEIRNLISEYTNEKELRDYLRGWLENFVPLPEDLQNEFLNQAVQNSFGLSVHPDKKIITLPYKALIIRAISG